MKAQSPSLKDRDVIVALSGGVDSAVAAILLQQNGANVQALHMTNWEDDDGYCSAATDLQDARAICERLDITLHHVNFAKEYQERVFAHFLEEYQQGRTPNPDILCNQEIKFGECLKYAERLGAELIATGHYAQSRQYNDRYQLLKAADQQKDQSYFLHAVDQQALSKALFPLGEVDKQEVRQIARDYGLEVHNKKDSTGICFIGERPFQDFIDRFLKSEPGPMQTPEGKTIGQHTGLIHYTEGQRQGLGIGGLKDCGPEPWYVVEKRQSDNVLVVAQQSHPARFFNGLIADQPHWIDQLPDALKTGGWRCSAKIRYRQPDQACEVHLVGDSLRVVFDTPQAAVAPGQYIVFYEGTICMGGACIQKPLTSTSQVRASGDLAVLS